MAERKPVLLAVDDDREVVRAVERDLRNRYARDFTVVAAGSGEEALDIVRQLVPRGDPLALVVTDQRMPSMTGVELLVHVAAIAPDAKRVLLTAYADTEVAMRAINDIRLDHYLMKPWHPPEERLYPVLDDLLEDWHAATRPATTALADGDGDALRVIGGRLSEASQRIRDLLANNQIPYHWIDVEDASAQRLLAEASLSTDRLPVVLRRTPSRSSPPTRPSLPSGSASRPTRSWRTTTSSSSAPAPPGSPPRSTALPKGCARSWSSGSRSEARLA